MSLLLQEALPPLLGAGGGWISKQWTSCPFIGTGTVPALTLKCPPPSPPSFGGLPKESWYSGTLEWRGIHKPRKGTRDLVHSDRAAKTAAGTVLRANIACL